MSGAHHFLTDVRFGSSPIHRLDPRAKIVGLIGFVLIAVTTPPEQVWAFALYLAILLFIVGLTRLPLGFVLRRALTVLPFAGIVAVFLPFFHDDGGARFELIGGLSVTASGLMMLWNVLAKATLGILAVLTLGLTTSFAELVAGLDGLRAPRLFTLIVSFMYRYVHVLLEEQRRMRRAMQARNHRGRWITDTTIVGHVISSLFMRSYHRGERVYVAMLSRGYDGTMPAATPPGIRRGEAAFAALLLLSVSLVRIGAAL